jgi:hypothetical protein
LDILNLARKDTILVTLAHSGKPVGHVTEFTMVRTMEAALYEWEPMELKYSKF